MAESARHKLGEEFRRLRRYAGLSNRRLAVMLGTSPATVSRTQTGRRVPSLPELDAWVEATGGGADDRARLRRLTDSAYQESRRN